MPRVDEPTDRRTGVDVINDVYPPGWPDGWLAGPYLVPLPFVTATGIDAFDGPLRSGRTEGEGEKSDPVKERRPDCRTDRTKKGSLICLLRELDDGFSWSIVNQSTKHKRP